MLRDQQQEGNDITVLLPVLCTWGVEIKNLAKHLNDNIHRHYTLNFIMQAKTLHSK